MRPSDRLPEIEDEINPEEWVPPFHIGELCGGLILIPLTNMS